jgi:putative chitinase
MLTRDIMAEMWPHGDVKIPGLVSAIAAAAPIVFSKYGLNSDLHIAHAMAQFSHECGAGNEVVENLNYSAQGLMNTWPSRFDASKAAAFAHDQKRIANEVYNGRMGNRPGTDDGWSYRGRGGSQVTGHEGYEALGRKVGLDPVNEPELVNNPQNFLECAVADFIICGCLPFAAQDDISGVTFHLNGGHIGLPERIVWLARWKAALSPGDTAGRGTVWVQQSLNKLGAEPPLIVDGTYGPATVAAVRTFQQSNGLDVDGKVGPQTIGAIEAALTALRSVAALSGA